MRWSSSAGSGTANAAPTSPSTGSISTLTHNQINDVVQIVQMTLNNMIPLITQAVKEAVAVPDEKVKKIDARLTEKEKKDVVYQQKIEKVEEEMKKMKVDMLAMKDRGTRDKVLEAIEKDKVDQSARANSVIFHGIPEPVQELDDDVKMAVKDIAKLVDAPIQNQFEVRRVGKKRDGKSRVLAVKFSAREDKTNLMAAKKKLKDSQDIKDDRRFSDKVTIFDDLTVPRQKLLRTVRDLPVTDFAFAKDGYILAKKKTSRSFDKLENVDDLFKLGVDNVTYSQFYNVGDGEGR